MGAGAKTTPKTPMAQLTLPRHSREGTGDWSVSRDHRSDYSELLYWHNRHDQYLQF
jgi:hypothetical protein